MSPAQTRKPFIPSQKEVNRFALPSPHCSTQTLSRFKTVKAGVAKKVTSFFCLHLPPTPHLPPTSSKPLLNFFCFLDPVSPHLRLLHWPPSPLPLQPAGCLTAQTVKACVAKMLTGSSIYPPSPPNLNKCQPTSNLILSLTPISLASDSFVLIIN